MIYSRQKGLLFAHVSRTGGTAITDCLLRSLADSKVLCGQHGCLADARLVLRDHFDEIFKFAFVRNPWERFVSWYALIGQKAHPDRSDLATLGDPDAEHWKGFDAFLEKWAADEVLIDGVTCRRLSQWSQLSDANGTLLTDDLCRFENFAEDAARVFAKSGISCHSLPRIGRSQHGHYSDYYTDFGRELVNHAFRDDVMQFGYRFDNTIC